MGTLSITQKKLQQKLKSHQLMVLRSRPQTAQPFANQSNLSEQVPYSIEEILRISNLDQMIPQILERTNSWLKDGPKEYGSTVKKPKKRVIDRSLYESPSDDYEHGPASSKECLEVALGDPDGDQDCSIISPRLSLQVHSRDRKKSKNLSKMVSVSSKRNVKGAARSSNYTAIEDPLKKPSKQSVEILKSYIRQMTKRSGMHSNEQRESSECLIED